jgi:hypothetical protein
MSSPTRTRATTSGNEWQRRWRRSSCTLALIATEPTMIQHPRIQLRTRRRPDLLRRQSAVRQRRLIGR